MKNEYLLAQNKVRQELSACLDFWLKNAPDAENGGVYTCLDRKGEVYSTDKSVWMQGRCAWMFSHLSNVYSPKQEWNALAKSCLDFMENHCINSAAGGRMYFTVTADGRPLRQRRYSFSEGFYAIANAEYYLLTGESLYLERALSKYEMIYQLNHGQLADPTLLGPKMEPATRQGRSLALPMIYLNICNVLMRCHPENRLQYSQQAAECAEEILAYHHKPDLGFTLETVGMKGEFWKEVSMGRVLNPGHAIECSWFLLEYAHQFEDSRLARAAQEIFDMAFAAGWDHEYGGLLYYVDALGKPPEAYEHDMKLWWPHNECLIASLMLYRHTRDQKYWNIFSKTLAYSLEVFSDPEYGEWYGYLRRDGKPTQPAAKGSTFKGPFHLPRMLVMLDKMLDNLLAE